MANIGEHVEGKDTMKTTRPLAHMTTTRWVSVLVGVAAMAVVTDDSAAMYHPSLGRFLQRDPVGTDGGAIRNGAPGRGNSGGSAQRVPLFSRAVRADPGASVAGGELPQQGPLPRTASPAGQDLAAHPNNFASVILSRTLGSGVVEANPYILRYADGANLYLYAGSTPATGKDPSGLLVLVCKVTTRFGFGKHVYFWDTTQGKSCGRDAWSSLFGPKTPDDDPNDGVDPYPDGGEPGPPTHECTAVKGSEGKESCLMNECKEHANDGIWFPFLNDCHHSLKRALDRCGLCSKLPYGHL